MSNEDFQYLTDLKSKKQIKLNMIKVFVDLEIREI